MKVSLLCLLLGLLVGCGQKGPLYLPEPEPETTQMSPIDSEYLLEEQGLQHHNSEQSRQLEPQLEPQPEIVQEAHANS